MNLELVKKRLKDGYEDAGFDVIDERPSGETILRYPVKGALDATLILCNEDVEDYTKLLNAHNEFATLPNPCSVVNRNYREALVHELDPTLDERDLRDFKFTPSDTGMTLELDRASLVYVNYFRFDPAYMSLCKDRLFAIPERFRKNSIENPIDIRQLFARPLTIRVQNINAKSINEAVPKSSAVIDGVLFTLAYKYDIPTMLATEFPQGRNARLEKLRANGHQLDNVIVPYSNFRSDFIKLYQAGVASTLPTQKYLSYFQVLEYFFQEVDNAGAYMAVSNLLQSNDFTGDDADVRTIINAVESNKKGQTAASLLSELIYQHIGTNAVRDFIMTNGGMAEESVQSLTARLVGIRDALLNPLDLPVSVDDVEIKRTVPLIKFLAEQVILAQT